MEHKARIASLPLPRRLVSTGAPWFVNLRAGNVLHESGLVVSFGRLDRPPAAPAVDPQTTSLDMCWAPGGSPVWALSADKPALRDTLRAFEATEQRAANRLLARLAQEAGRAWLVAWAQSGAESGPAAAAAHGRDTEPLASAAAASCLAPLRPI